jgi:nicotinamide-nucleotide adenylyltransferase
MMIEQKQLERGSERGEGDMKSNNTHGLGTAAEADRYRAAERLLQSPARMVAIERAVADLDIHGPPALRSFTGGARLQSAMRIGFFPGSFNPLTNAHVALSDAARTQARLDTLVWALAVVTIDKERVSRASVPDRLAQLIAFARPRHETAALVNRGLYVDQVHALRALVQPEARVFVLVGFDKVVQIFDPRYYADREAALTALFSQADLLVAPRDEAGAPALAALLALPENQPYARHVALLDLPAAYLSDSSTEARQLAAAPEAHQDELTRLVPPEARALIATQAYAATDVYALRQAWLAVLQPLPMAILRALPPIATLVARTRASGELRRALLDAQSHPTPATARDLLHQLGVAS